MSLQGVLSDFGVAEVFQLISQQRKTGVLEIDAEPGRIDVTFSGGMVLRAQPGDREPDTALADYLLRTGMLSEPVLAEARRGQKQTLEPLAGVLLSSESVREEDLERVGKLVTQETIFELFRLDEGSFRFRPMDEVESRIGDEPVGAEQMLLDALRMRDEWGDVERHLADLSTVLVASTDIEFFHGRRAEVAGDAGISPEDLERLFRLADGRQSARRIIDLSRLGTFTGAKGLVALRLAGLVRAEVRTPADKPEEEKPEPRWRPGFALVATGVSVAVAIALLLLPLPESSDHPVPGDSLRAARSAAQTDRVRLYLEARRWVQGRYPTALSSAEEHAGAFLAPLPADRYIYERGTEGYRLDRVLP